MKTIMKIIGVCALVHSIGTTGFFILFEVPTKLFIVFILSIEFAIGILFLMLVKNKEDEEKYHGRF